MSETTPVTAKPEPAPVRSIASAVNQQLATKTPTPKGLTLFNTKELTSGYFHGCVYGDTGVRKSVTAARFGKAATTAIILTRRKEQLIPLRDEGYSVALVENASALRYAAQFPEKLWPDWANVEDRLLVIDDATEAVNMLVEDNQVIDGKEVRDPRRSYRAAGEDLKELTKSCLRKPMHLVLVAVAKVRENSLTNEERIGPDLPPSMLSMLLTELEFVWYIKPSTWKFVTERDFITFQEPDEKGVLRTYRREIFAKSKIPIGLVNKNVLHKEEDMDIRAIWERIRKGEAVR